jgi:hypothetical protein
MAPLIEVLYACLFVGRILRSDNLVYTTIPTRILLCQVRWINGSAFVQAKCKGAIHLM